MEKTNSKKFISLKKNKDFQRVYQHGFSAADRNLVIYKLKTSNNETRIGFSVSKKFGNAVKRNRAKRILREICRLNLDVFEDYHDYIIIVRMAAKDQGYHELKSSVLNVLKKLNNFRGKNND